MLRMVVFSDLDCRTTFHFNGIAWTCILTELYYVFLCRPEKWEIIAGFIATLVKKFLNNDSGAKFELAFYFMSPFYTP